ncbi:unnamed protein product [Vicia faba]|uniref:Uncharacterized protein n=1 Tax=Vicia faba TaxID=3906 RepID=A0AAV0YIR1_VICFA|nr:unnamed protein product [Vicia faba]
MVLQHILVLVTQLFTPLCLLLPMVLQIWLNLASGTISSASPSPPPVGNGDIMLLLEPGRHPPRLFTSFLVIQYWFHLIIHGFLVLLVKLDEEWEANTLLENQMLLTQPRTNYNCCF